MSSVPFKRRVRKRLPTSTNMKTTIEIANTTPTTISAYSKSFLRHLIDHHVYPNRYQCPGGTGAAEPEEWEDTDTRLTQPRPSLSPSQFSDDAFGIFTRPDEDAAKEAQVGETLLPFIESRIKGGKFRAGEVSFSNLHSLTDVDPCTSEWLKPAKPDIYCGARSEQLDRLVRKDLDGYIVPASVGSSPARPARASGWAIGARAGSPVQPNSPLP
ncbi:MAG: hypothetical protein MMC23_009862 [Stictis urceolatum]|nr:hypothetical protein [Stictis urceolata]